MENVRMTIPTAGLVVVEKRKLLLAFSSHKQAWYLPGGRLDRGETPLMALIREAREELNIELSPDELRF